MYIDQLSDGSTVYASDLEVVNNDLCHQLNQTVWNIEKSSYFFLSPTLSDLEYLKCHCQKQGRCRWLFLLCQVQ